MIFEKRFLKNFLKCRLMLCFVFCIFSFTGLHAQNFSATAKIDTNAILIGKQVKLTLQLTHPKNQNIHWTEIPDTLGKIVKQLESCNYETEAGYLKNNVAFSFKQFFHFLPVVLLLPAAFFLDNRSMFMVYQFTVYQIFFYLIYSIMVFKKEQKKNPSTPVYKWIKEIFIAVGCLSIVFLIQLYTKSINLYIRQIYLLDHFYAHGA